MREAERKLKRISIHFIIPYELLGNVEMVRENWKRKICGHRMNVSSARLHTINTVYIESVRLFPTAINIFQHIDIISSQFPHDSIFIFCSFRPMRKLTWNCWIRRRPEQQHDKYIKKKPSPSKLLERLDCERMPLNK